jgi:hypothetical protein
MPYRAHRLIALLALLAPVCLSGCEFISYKPKGASPLVPLELTNDSAELEVIFIRVPAGDPDFNVALWRDVDEQALPAALRSELAANGFRAGVVGSESPPVLARKLSAGEDRTAPPATAAAKLESEPAVRRTRLQIHRGRPGNIIASGIYDQLSLLVREDDQVRGKTYPQAQGDLVIEVDPQPDHRVALSLLPELKYGEARQQWVAEDGIFRLQSGKSKKTFDKLKLEATLGADQTLIVTSLPERSGSLGHYFFTESKSGHPEQKLLLIRLTETKSSDLFIQVNDGAGEPTSSK